jgi:hypothetical protein
MIGILAFATASTFATYDCTVQPPATLRLEGSSAQVTPIQFPGVTEKDWKFSLRVLKGDGYDAEVKWPSNPMQIEGKFPALITADGSIAFSAYSTGPCLFTETMCMSLVHLVDHGAGSADLIISPTALATAEDGKSRNPFIVVIQGRCSRIGPVK